jgi:hypothetical protein
MDKRPLIGAAHSWQPPRMHRCLTDAFGPYARLHLEPSLRERVRWWLKAAVVALMLTAPFTAYIVACVVCN